MMHGEDVNLLNFIDLTTGTDGNRKFSFQLLKNKWAEEVAKNAQGASNYELVHKLSLMVRFLQFNNQIVWSFAGSITVKGDTIGYMKDDSITIVTMNWKEFESLVQDKCVIFE